MSWSARAAGTPKEALAKFIEQATTSWGYSHSLGDKENIDQAIAYLVGRVAYLDNGVPTTILELDGSGHWDDVTGLGNVSVGLRVLADRRRT